MKMLMVLIAVVMFFGIRAIADDGRVYVAAKKQLTEQDQAYLNHLKQKKTLADENRRGIEEFKRKRAWLEWRNEGARKQFVQRRESSGRQPASVEAKQGRENFRKEYAARYYERENAREQFVRERNAKEKAKREIQSVPLSDEVLRRNLEPWNE